MAKKENNLYPKPVETLTHKDRRVNIPTEELRDFVADQEAQPKTILYPRDPSLDPQLVWKGTDETILSLLTERLSVQSIIVHNLHEIIEFSILIR